MLMRNWMIIYCDTIVIVAISAVQNIGENYSPYTSICNKATIMIIIPYSEKFSRDPIFTVYGFCG